MYNIKDGPHLQDRSIFERGTSVMPRIRQLANQYANEDFVKEIRKRMIDLNYVSIADVAKTINVDPRTLYRRINDPGKFCVKDLRKLIPLLRLNPDAILALLGYSKKDISNYLDRRHT